MDEYYLSGIFMLYFTASKIPLIVRNMYSTNEGKLLPIKLGHSAFLTFGIILYLLWELF